MTRVCFNQMQDFPSALCSMGFYHLIAVTVHLYPLHLLWVHVGPSQPSLQTQVKDSPFTTQVPPFSQGLGRQLEFLAVKEKKKKKRKEKLLVSFPNTKHSQKCNRIS